METIIVVGGGILGTMHAWHAWSRGLRVTHIEQDLEPRGATVRNFGLVWVSGRAPGEELAMALRARSLWQRIAADVPGIGFRPDGSLTVVTDPRELAVLEQVEDREDAADRDLLLLDAGEARQVNPALRGDYLAALFCRRDAIVESRRALPALRAAMAGPRYRWLPGRTVLDIGTGRAADSAGEIHGADRLVVCPGAHPGGRLGDLTPIAPVRRVRLQMMQTAPLGEHLTTAVADCGSLRYYPAFDVPARSALPPADPESERLRLQLLIAQRAGGELTIGDTHEYDEPFDFAQEEAPYALLRARAEALLGRSLPPVARTWSGVYLERADGGICVREQVLPGVTLVTGAGGRGMTLAPAIAEATIDALLGVPA